MNLSNNMMLFKGMNGLGADQVYVDPDQPWLGMMDAPAAAAAQPSGWDKFFSFFGKATDAATKVAPIAADVAQQIAILKANQAAGGNGYDASNSGSNSNGDGSGKAPMSTINKVLIGTGIAGAVGLATWAIVRKKKKK